MNGYWLGQYELTVQAARAQRVELTEEQKRRLEELKVRNEQRDPNVFDSVQQNPANSEFMVRDFTGLMLQASLAAKAGLPSQYVMPEHVVRFYQEHKADYGELPDDPVARKTAWQRIDSDIRQKLAPQLEAEYQKNLQKFIEQLKASANISKNPPPA